MKNDAKLDPFPTSEEITSLQNEGSEAPEQERQKARFFSHGLAKKSTNRNMIGCHIVPQCQENSLCNRA
ncbi:uncharacterized protein RAG0_04243 [Rhynchosporium agropyri]|uniref:Uncharacterized protein n=2 Tax=Rhynchosporium TaxID=38037 RepID=A0A1E1ML82_RHYSE|nr:uncharacterized protein RAG0_04243 [Rhynchosporium agropyri]CZT49525.1 uncharacterized protein RSE6_10386 [Rhynchosporium secalis]